MAGWKATAALMLVLLFITAHAQQLGDITGAIANHVDTVACNLAGQVCTPAYLPMQYAFTVYSNINTHPILVFRDMQCKNTQNLTSEMLQLKR